MPVTLNGALQVLIFLAIVLLLTKPIGLYMTSYLLRETHLALACFWAG